VNTTRHSTAAYVLPFVLFLGGLLLVPLVKKIGGESLVFSRPEFWIYPLQTLVCGAVLIAFRKYYSFDFSRGIFWAAAAGLFSLAIWISPQWLFGAPPRMTGFNPELLRPDAWIYRLTVAARFLRLVIVVPFMEEIFWRGFLMRFLIRERFEEVPFGEYRLFSFSVTALLFGLEHSGPDLIPGILTGVIYNALAVRTRSLGACVLAHAVTNLGLGIYIMETKQWGFW